VTCGLHAPSLLESNNLRPGDVFVPEKLLPVIHGYPMSVFSTMCRVSTYAQVRAGYCARATRPIVCPVSVRFHDCTLSSGVRCDTHSRFPLGNIGRGRLAKAMEFPRIFVAFFPLWHCFQEFGGCTQPQERMPSAIWDFISFGRCALLRNC